MKIAHIITSLNTGGAEKLVVDSVPLYEKNKLDIDVIILNNKKTSFYESLRNNFSGKIIGLTSGSVYNPMLIYKLISIIRKYDIVHIHLFPTLYWVVIAKWLSFSSTKIIYTEHSTNNRRRKIRIFKFIDRIIYRGIDRIITISEAVEFSIKKHLSINNDRFILINNGVDILSFNKANSYTKESFFNSNDILLIQVSSFRYPKDQPTLIQSLTKLTDKYKLLLVGDGELRVECEKLVKQLDLEERVKFLGLRSDIPELLQTSDIIVLSSFYEGLSLSSIEGMACKPFIASDVPGLKEIVKDNGLVFQQGNSEELAKHIIKLTEDSEYYNSIAKKCKERAQEFDINMMVEKYMKVYKTVLNEN